MGFKDAFKNIGKTVLKVGATAVGAGGLFEGVQMGAVEAGTAAETDPLISAIVGAVTAILMLIRELRKSKVI